MTVISVRLPDVTETGLSREAQLGQRPRSEIVREAIEQYLAHREHERFMQKLVTEARTAYGIDTVRRESRDLLDEAEQDDEPADNKGDSGQWWR